MTIPVLHLSSNVGIFGAENVILTLAKEMRSSKFTPIIGVLRNEFNPHTELAEEAKRNNIETEIFPCKGKLDFRTIKLIRNFSRVKNIRILHSHGYKSNFYGLLASRNTDLKLVSTCHNWIRTDRRLRLYSHVDKFILKFFKKIVTVSDELKQEIFKIASPDQEVITINNGIYLKDFDKESEGTGELKKNLGVSPDCKLIGTVGRLSCEKGYDYLLNAAKVLITQFPNIEFLIAGDGPQRKELEEIVAKLQINHKVIFTGHVDKISSIYPLIDIYVISSTSEGLPISLLEAMAFKKPIIATRVGSIPKVLNHGKEGILIEPANDSELANAIKDLFCNEAKARELGKNAYTRVATDFSSAAMAAKYLNLYETMIE